MSFHRWLQDLRSALAPSLGQRQQRRRGSFRAATHRINLEALENRCLLSFSPAVSYPVGQYPHAVVAADFNHDTVLDLAVPTGNKVTVLLGNSNGTFRAPANYGTGTVARSIAVGDFNRDGNPDLAITNSTGVSVLPGNGLGAFGSPSNFTVPDVPSSVAVGDFNGDGLLDLGVTSNALYQSSYYSGGGYDGRVNVLLGNGVGGFSQPQTTDLGYGYETSAVAMDFNGDGIDDLATANTDGGGVSVLLNGLNSSTFLPTDGNPTSVAAADVNGDAAVDLVAANNSGTVSVLLGDGRGGFGALHNYASGSWGQSVAVGDFNHDNMLDIVTSGNQYAGGGNTGHVQLLLGHGNGTFDIPISQSLNFGVLASGVATGDFNGDGLPDVAVTSTNDFGNGNANVFINAGSMASPASLIISDVTVTEGNTGTALAVFTVARGDNLNGTASVNYSTANGGALAGSDYVAKSGMLTFGPGETSKTITILVKGDLIDEYDQGFYVNLSAATGANIKDGQGVGTILDNDPPPSITITTKVSAREGNTGTTSFNFIVTLSAPSEKEVRVNFATANGTATTADNDYVAQSGSLTFAPGQTSKTISIAVKGDKKNEATETFFLNLSSATNATILHAQGIGEILDDDTQFFGAGR